MGKYDAIINLPHHVSDYHRQMPMEHRAAQFAPFAALSGHEEAMQETERLTEQFRELSEENIRELSRKLIYAIEKSSLIEITFFIPDKIKSGGYYRKIKGVIKNFDETENTLLLDNGRIIPVKFVSYIKFLHCL